MTSGSDYLSEKSIDWALSRINSYGDTDIFPVPFEYEVIKHDWPNIKSYLCRVDLTTYQTKAFIRCLVPKPAGGYRAAIQLDPIDTVLYSAMAYECAEAVEQARAPKNIACSYRVKLEPKGQLFEPVNSWNDYYQASSRELAASGKFNYVVLADISDFYNQIYHHRLTNNLQSAGVSEARTNSIERYLFNLTSRHHSRGVPVGQFASILLSEACLIDIDEALRRSGYIHTRFVDDFRIFCKNRSEAYSALHFLSEYLYTAHRLTFQGSKVWILSMEEFKQRELEDPEQLENQTKTGRVNTMLVNLLKETGYPHSEEDIESNELVKITYETLCDVLNIAVSSNPLPLGISRYVLRRGRTLGGAALQPFVLNNLEKLAPVFRDVILYLIRSVRPKNASYVGDMLFNFITSSDIAFLPYLQVWSLDAFVTKKELVSPDRAWKFVNSIQTRYGSRYRALMAREFEFYAWVRSNKENWNSNSPWESRAILWSGKALSRDERHHWLADIASNHEDVLTKAVAKAVLGGL